MKTLYKAILGDLRGLEIMRKSLDCRCTGKSGYSDGLGGGQRTHGHPGAIAGMSYKSLCFKVLGTIPPLEMQALFYPWRCRVLVRRAGERYGRGVISTATYYAVMRRLRLIGGFWQGSSEDPVRPRGPSDRGFA